VNIINFKKADKPRGDQSQLIRFFVVVEFRHFLMLFFSFITYLVVFSLYLAITLRKNLKRLNRRRRKILLFFFIKVDKGDWGEMWIKTGLNVNIINFAKVDKGGGKTLILKMWIICHYFKLSLRCKRRFR